MTRWLEKVGLVANLTLRGFTRERGFWVMMAAAILSSALGWWWRDINFGGEPGRFVLSFGLSIQSVGAIVLAIVMVGQLKARQLHSGHLEVLLARGTAPSIVVAGEVLGVLALVAVFIGGCAGGLGIALVVGGYSPPWSELIVSSSMQVMKVVVILAFCRWFSAFGRSLFFIMMASALLTVVGHVKTWTETLGGMGWWLTRPVPNLSWLGGAGISPAGFDAGEALRALVYTAGYLVIFLVLASKAEARRE